MANTGWASGKHGRYGVRLFDTVANAAVLETGSSNPQDLGNTARAAATVRMYHVRLQIGWQRLLCRGS